jgi:type II secretory pathway component PulJ
MNSNLKNRKAFTMIELLVTIAISMVAFMLIFRFLSTTRHHYMYGTVNLQNLQEGRLAINYLRRDFSCACPALADPEPDKYEVFQRARKQLFSSATWEKFVNNHTEPVDAKLIQVLPKQLAFYKYVFMSPATREGVPDEIPKVELVRYMFDKPSKTLTRQGQDGKTQDFTGIEDVEFKIYVHQLNEARPILWVRLKIHEGEKIYGSERFGNALELTASIVAPFISSSVNGNSWRFETWHKKP